jgi:hypothetical protein
MSVENGNESKSNQRDVRCDTLDGHENYFACRCAGIICAWAARMRLLA